VDRDTPGLSVRDYATWDGGRAAEVLLEGVRVGADALLGPEGGGLDLIEAVADRAVAALCAEAVGCMAVLNADIGEYSRTRKQFGAPIGSFQAVQHRLVDMYIAQEQSLSLTYLATLKLDAPAAERRKAVSAAKVQVGQAGRFVGQQAVQLHGGMGMTEELRVGHYFRRLTAIDTLFGDVDHHLRRFAAA
jgi:alkylation response protein AidB-like acyl-CoA dehydrogenase